MIRQHSLQLCCHLVISLFLRLRRQYILIMIRLKAILQCPLTCLLITSRNACGFNLRSRVNCTTLSNSHCLRTTQCMLQLPNKTANRCFVLWSVQSRSVLDLPLVEWDAIAHANFQDHLRVPFPMHRCRLRQLTDLFHVLTGELELSYKRVLFDAFGKPTAGNRYYVCQVGIALATECDGLVKFVHTIGTRSQDPGEDNLRRGRV